MNESILGIVGGKRRGLRYTFLLILTGDLLKTEIHLLNHLLKLLVDAVLHALGHAHFV